MKLRFAILCDGITETDGKMSFLGIFDQFRMNVPGGPFALPPCWLAVWVDADAGEGTEHDLQVALLRDDTGEEIVSWTLGEAAFHPTQIGWPPCSRSRLLIEDVLLPEVGDYRFQVEVDGQPVGSTRFCLTVAETGNLSLG